MDRFWQWLARNWTAKVLTIPLVAINVAFVAWGLEIVRAQNVPWYGILGMGGLGATVIFVSVVLIALAWSD